MLANQVFRKLKVLTNVNIFIMKTFITLLLLLSFGSVRAADLFIEAESFSNKGGWKVDQQFMDLMGSPYLLAHGMGVPVDDASTEVTFNEKGEYASLVQADDILSWLEEHPEIKIEKELSVLKELNEESNPVVVLVK